MMNELDDVLIRNEQKADELKERVDTIDETLLKKVDNTVMEEA